MAKESGTISKNAKKHKGSRSPDIADKHKRRNFLKMAKKMVKKGNKPPPFASWDDMKKNLKMTDMAREKFAETLLGK